MRVVGDETDAARNPVGETHEDVDGLFGVLHESLINKDIVTYDGLVEAIKYAFRDYRLPVVVLPVDATLDYKAFYAPYVNKHLSGYGYSDVESGYHVLRISDEFEHGAAFKKWQSPTFVDVALSRDELPPEKRPPPFTRFMPTLMLVDSPWRPAKILHSRPTGKPPVAKLAEYDYSQVTRDMAHLMKNHDANVRAGVKENWAAFVAQRPKEQADADVNSCLPNWDRFVIRPPDAATGGHRVNARSAAMQSAVSVVAENRITNDAQEQTALRNANAANAAASDESMMMRLEPGTFVFVKMEWTDAGGCQIPLCLAELPDPLPAGDSTAAGFECTVKWWEPEPQPRHEQKGTYDSKWRKWKERRGRAFVHSESAVKRDRMALIGVRFTREAELAGGFRKLNVASLAKIREVPDSRYGDFSSPASSSS